MDVVEFAEPRTHVIIKDFLTQDEQNLLWDEIKENELKFEAGLYQKDGKEDIHENMKKNLGFDVTQKYFRVDDSSIRSMFYHRIFKNESMIRIFI